MAATLVELAVSIVSSNATMSKLTGDDLSKEIQKVYATLLKLENQETAPAENAPAMTLKKAFQADQVCCLICGKTGMKTLTRHLSQTHTMKPGEYRRMFGIPSSQPLTARKFSEERKKMAQDRGLADNLAKARAVRAAKIKAKKGAEAPKKAAAPKAPKAAPKAAKAAPKAAVKKKVVKK
jgi:predicted transcriptional regulator